MKLPLLYQVRQQFESERIEDISETVQTELARLELRTKCQPGQSIALTAGSRGIANLPEILKSVVAECRELGLEPFIVPAMGTHGGATAEGQAKVLEKYGITESSTGAPVRASMEVIDIGKTEDGVPVVLDRNAAEADWIGVVNRIKPHTKFTGNIESGLCKMFLIGLGKATGARIYHRAAVHLSFERVAETAVPLVLQKANILFGLGIIENSYDETASLHAVACEELIEKEKELLILAKRLMPRLPFDSFDVVIVDMSGKNYSGTGLDTNIVGSKSGIEITRVYVRDLHPASGGNAAGIGYVHLVHERLVEKIDFKATSLNCRTANSYEAARIPITFGTDREALEAALDSIGLTEPEDARVCWIPNTLELGEVWLSEALMAGTRERSDLTIESGPYHFQFNDDGDFVPLPDMFSAGEH